VKKTKIVLKNRLKKMRFLGDKCYLCGTKLQPHNPNKNNGFTMDHVVAKSKGGNELKPCCRLCNERKADMDIIEIPKGTIIKVNEIPFELVRNTEVFGDKANSLESEKINENNTKTV
jgi:hypothetical protein